MAHISRYTRLITDWAIIILAALVPVFVVPLQWYTIPQAKLLLVAFFVIFVALAWIVSRVLHGSLLIPRHFTLWGSAFLPVVYLVSALLSGYGWTSIASGDASTDTVVVVAIWYMLLALVAVVCSQSEKPMETYIRAALIGILALVLFQAARIFFPDITSLGAYLSGNSSSIFGSWHDLGIVAGLGIFLSLALWNSSMAESNIWRGVLLALGAVSFFMLLVVNAIDVWFGVALVAILFALWTKIELWRAGHPVARIARTPAVIAWIVLAIITVSCGVWSSQVFNHLPAKMQIVQLEVRPSWQGTYMIGEKALSGRVAFLFGSGPNTFTRDWGLFKPVGVNMTDYWNMDFNAGIGFIPTTFVTSGFLGILAWLIFALGVLWSFLKALRGRTSMHGILPAMLGAVMYLFAFHIMYLPGIALSAILFIFVGFVIALEAREEGALFSHLSLRPASFDAYAPVLLAGLAAIVFLAAPLTAARAVISDLYVQHAVVAYNANNSNLDAPVSYVRKAIAIYPHNDLAQRAAVQLGLLQLQQLINNAKDDASKAALQARLQDTIAHGLSAVTIDSADYQNWLSLAVLYQNLAGVGIAGAYDNARNAYERTMADNPTNPLPRVQYAQLALAQKDVDTAKTQLDKAIELKPNFGIAYYLRSQILAGKGDYQAAAQDAGAAAQLAQQDPLAWYNLGAILFASGQYQYSVQALSQAVSLQNNYANAIFLIGLSWDKLGDHSKALAAMQEVARLNPSDPTVLQIVANLQAGMSAVPQTQTPAQPQQTPKKGGR